MPRLTEVGRNNNIVNEYRQAELITVGDSELRSDDCNTVIVTDVELNVAYRHRRRTDRSRWTWEFHPRGTDHSRDAVRTSPGAVLYRCHQVWLQLSVLTYTLIDWLIDFTIPQSLISLISRRSVPSYSQTVNHISSSQEIHFGQRPPILYTLRCFDAEIDCITLTVKRHKDIGLTS